METLKDIVCFFVVAGFSLGLSFLPVWMVMVASKARRVR